MTTAPSTLALRVEDERRTALRALLVEPFVGAEAPAFRLIRRHDVELARRCADFLGYRLHVTPGFARLVKVPTERALRRGLRVPPSGVSARDRSRDEWPRLSDRGVVLLFLTLAALERGSEQTVIGELADDVASAAARCEPPLPVDFERRTERVAFADGLELLCHWCVLRLVHGRRGAFANRIAEDEEALFTIDRKRLALVLRDPFAALGVRSGGDLLSAAEVEPATAEAATQRVRHRVARRLVEDPVLYVDELSDEERAYFLSQRALLERRVEDWVGLAVERRAEGSAAVEAGRELTDLPFPAGSTVKQLALLMCDWLAERRSAGSEEVPWSDVRRTLRTFLARHERHWNRSADDEDVVETMLNEVTGVLVELDLATHRPEGLRPQPLCARFRSPALKEAGAT